MARPEFPTVPIGTTITSPPEQTHPFAQLTFEGITLEQTEQLELGNCLIASPVTYRKLVGGNRWQCHIVVEPDIFHPEQSGEYEAIAQEEHADSANRCHLRPGDRATMTGKTRQEIIKLANGAQQTISY